MTARATLEDRLTFQHLRRALAGVLRSRTVGGVAALAKAHRAAAKAIYPARDDDDLAVMRQWYAMIGSYLAGDDDAARLHVSALMGLQASVADILGPMADPALDADTRSQERLPPRPYYLDD